MDDAREQRIQDYLFTFSTSQGQRVLEDMRKAYGDRTSFSTDPIQMAFNEGKRYVYLSITKVIEEARTKKSVQAEAL